MIKSAVPRVALWVKLAFTAFLAVLVPYYWQAYGPTNFLYFCDVALFFALAALWLESPLLASMPAVGILLPQALWMIDFLAGLVGLPLTGMTAYMFDPALTLFTRGLSLFHFWLPILLVWLVARLGYDARAFWYWTAVAWGLLLVCFLWMPPAAPNRVDRNIPVNINYVYGFNDDEPQTWMPPLAYFGLLMAALPLAIFWPTHLLLRWAFAKDGVVSPLASRSLRA